MLVINKGEIKIMQYNKYKEKFNQEGYFVLRKYFDKKIINKINQKLKILINDYNNFYPIKNIKSYKNLKLMRKANGTLKNELQAKDLKKGYLYYQKLTNSMSLKDPMILIPEINKLIFNSKSIKVMQNLFGGKVKLGYIKLGIFFKNNLPINCINYFHTDDMKKKNDKEIKKKDLILKISVPLNINNSERNEFSIIKQRKTLTKINKQYFMINEIDKNYINKISNPILRNGDAVVFDPMNFFHKADKPKKSIRAVLYIEYISNKNFKHVNKTKIRREYLNKLNNFQRMLTKSLIIT